MGDFPCFIMALTFAGKRKQAVQTSTRSEAYFKAFAFKLDARDPVMDDE